MYINKNKKLADSLRTINSTENEKKVTGNGTNVNVNIHINMSDLSKMLRKLPLEEEKKDEFMKVEGVTPNVS